MALDEHLSFEDAPPFRAFEFFLLNYLYGHYPFRLPLQGLIDPREAALADQLLKPEEVVDILVVVSFPKNLGSVLFSI